MNRLRQVGISYCLYMDTHGGRFPRSYHSAGFDELNWEFAIAEYLEPTVDLAQAELPVGLRDGAYRCPEHEPKTTHVRSFGQNVWFELSRVETGAVVGSREGPLYRKLSSVAAKSRTVLVAEIDSRADHLMAHFWHRGASPEVAVGRHSGAENYLWVDAHVTTSDFRATFDLGTEIDRWDPGQAGEP